MLIYNIFQFQEVKLKRLPFPYELLKQTHKRKVDNQFVDQKSLENFGSENFLYFLSLEKYIVNVHMFQNRIVARYKVETTAAKDDASSSQIVDATQIYLFSQSKTLRHKHK